MTPVTDDVLDLTFREARTANTYLDRPVSQDTLHELYDLLKWGPTSSNQQPLRIVWCTSQTAKNQLAEFCAEGNANKVRIAPVVAILGMDLDFVRHLPRMFLHGDARPWYGDDPVVLAEHALRNSSLQAGYFIIAARLLGLGINPMLGIDESAVNRTFFPASRVRVNMIATMGYGDSKTVYPRAPRFEFDEVNRII